MGKACQTHFPGPTRGRLLHGPTILPVHLMLSTFFSFLQNQHTDEWIGLSRLCPMVSLRLFSGPGITGAPSSGAICRTMMSSFHFAEVANMS